MKESCRFHSFFLIVKHGFPMKADLELLYAQNHIFFALAESRLRSLFLQTGKSSGFVIL